MFCHHDGANAVYALWHGTTHGSRHTAQGTGNRLSLSLSLSLLWKQYGIGRSSMR